MDPYYKKTIIYKTHGVEFKFDVANTIFSTFDLDIGTQLLLRTVKLRDETSLLDIGCGYGALGIVLGKMHKLTKVTMVDKDMLSVRYSQINILQNDVGNAEVIPSIGLEKVPPFQYDYIVSNIPAKIGDEAIEKDFILKPLEYLKPEGEYWFVVVTALNRLIPEIGVKHSLKLKQMVKKNRYAVYRISR